MQVARNTTRFGGSETHAAAVAEPPVCDSCLDSFALEAPNDAIDRRSKLRLACACACALVVAANVANFRWCSRARRSFVEEPATPGRAREASFDFHARTRRLMNFVNFRGFDCLCTRTANLNEIGQFGAASRDFSELKRPSEAPRRSDSGTVQVHPVEANA